MNSNRLSLAATLLLVAATSLNGCAGGGSSVKTAMPQAALHTPNSVSPGSVKAPPMSKAVAPASLMNGRRPKGDQQPLGWTQIDGAASVLAASPDGTLWALSTVGPTSGPDKYIFHYANGSWTNVPGAGIRIAVGPDNTAYVVNSAGGIYQYDGSPWKAIVGGAQDITVAVDGSLYVISNVQNPQYGNAIFHYSGGVWTQMPGAAQRIVASWDPGTYIGYIAPGGYIILNQGGAVYFFDPVWSQYNPFGIQDGQNPPQVADITPTKTGAVYALALTADSIGGHNVVFEAYDGYNRVEGGSAVSISNDGATVYVAGPLGGIYKSPITPTGPPVTFDRPTLYLGTGRESCGNTYDYCLPATGATVYADQTGNAGPFRVATWCRENGPCNCVNTCVVSGKVVEAAAPGSGGPKSIDVYARRAGRALLLAGGNSGGDGNLPAWVQTVSTGITFSAISGAQTYTVKYGGDWGSEVAVNAAAYPPAGKTVTIYDMKGSGTGNASNGGPLLTNYIEVTVSDGSSNVVDKVVPVSVRIGADNPVAINIP